TFLNCSGLGFLNVPKNLPVNTTRLDLSSNNITTLFNNDFSELTNLRYLDLSINLISLIQSGSRLLSPLTKLEVLDISNNGLASLPNDIFSELKNLQMIVLTNNKLIFIPDVTTSNTNSNFHISLYGNVLYCGCPSVKFLLWL
ncbi:hypothetical protein LOTGIDRAFT_77193, partial [Lottia gigantea]